MFTHRFLTCVAALGVLATACTTELHDPNEGFEEVSIEITGEAPEEAGDLFSPETKTTMDETLTSGWRTLWYPREYIGVYGKYTRNAKFKSTNSSVTSSPTYTGSVSWGDTPKYTYYPYSSANSKSGYTSVKHVLPLEQEFDTEKRALAYDFKFGSVTTSGSIWNRKYTFNWDAMPMTFIRIKLNAAGTPFVGEKLESFTMTVPEGRRLGGGFTADLSTKEITWTSGVDGFNSMTVTYPDTPALEAETMVSYLTCAPAGIQSGDVVVFTIKTDKHTIKTTRQINATILANKIYNLTFNLASLDLDVAGTPVEELDFESFGFEVADNEGKILAQELYYDSNYYLDGTVKGSTTSRQVTSKSLAVDTENKTIQGCIPYLYDFTLVPTFTLTADATVKVNGNEVISGKTPVTFTNGAPVVFELATDSGSNLYEVTLTNTGLPVVVLQSDGAGTVDWRQAGIDINGKSSEWSETEKLSIYNADGSVSLENALCGFKLRGNSTKKYPKKPFAIKLAQKANLLNIMPDGGKHKRWCLLANWSDHSLMRNALAMTIANRTIDAWKAAGAEQGLVWNPSGKNVELVIDGVHVGNYLLCEQIKIDGDRLDIMDPYEDVTDPTINNCGFLMEFDDNYDENSKFVTSRGLPCQFKDDISYSLLTQIETKVNNLEKYLKNQNYTAAFELIDIASVADWWIIHELAMNKEYRHPKSVYMYMNGNSKLFAGPVWDFDYQTFPNIDNVNSIQGANGTFGFAYSDWLYGSSSPSNSLSVSTSDAPYMWYPLLFKSSAFRAKVQERWAILEPALRAVASDIASLGAANATSWKHNFEMWPIESGERQRRYVGNLKYDDPNVTVNYDTWFIEYCGDERLTSYDAVVTNLQTVYMERLNQMDSMITSGNFVTTAR